MKRTLACFGSLSLASGKIYFSETFGSGWEDRWTVSKWKDSEGTQGKWVATAGKWFKDEKEDIGIQTSEDSKFFGISTSFDSFSNAGKELIIQYQAKYEKDIECGGGYLKIGPKLGDLTTFGDPTQYNIMFGPDKCGYTKRTHLIFNYDGKNVLKKSDLSYKQEGEGTSHLYRMLLKPDNTVRVEIDEEKIYEGSLKEDWEMLKPKEIPDPDDKKPGDWVGSSKFVAVSLLASVAFASNVTSIVDFNSGIDAVIVSAGAAGDKQGTFQRSQEQHEHSMGEIMKNMTSEHAMAILRANPKTTHALLELAGSMTESAGSLRGHLRAKQNPNVPAGYKGAQKARDLLNEMISESMENYDLEIAKCTNYYSD